MANPEHVERLNQGIASWNNWRFNSQTPIDLSGVDLHNRNLRGADLYGADLSHANLREAKLTAAHLGRANLSHANLSGAILERAELGGANLSDAKLEHATLRHGVSLIDAQLSQADLSGADLRGANLSRADLSGANLSYASLRAVILNATFLDGTILTEVYLRDTVFANVDLTSAIGLETCEHGGPSKIDYQTLQRSGSLPIEFLRGVGLPEALIEYLPALSSQAIQHYSCFISYSTADHEFAERLYADLQNKGVRCWFDRHDMPIGGKVLDEIDAAIRMRDKLLLILSERSIKSDWVEDEVTKAFAEERKRGQIVLFPIRIDDEVLTTEEAWAAKLRDGRHIGEFRRWKDHDAYKESFDRVVRDLTIQPKVP